MVNTGSAQANEGVAFIVPPGRRIQYVCGEVHTNGLENFWSLVKRGLKGTYISVEPFNLFRYLDEQVFRYKNRKMNDGDRFNMVVREIVGKRLTWNQLTGKEDAAPPIPRTKFSKPLQGRGKRKTRPRKTYLSTPD